MLNDVQIWQDGLGSLPPLLYLVSLDHLSPDPLSIGPNARWWIWGQAGEARLNNIVYGLTTLE